MGGGGRGEGGALVTVWAFFLTGRSLITFFFFYKLPPATGHTYSLFILVLVVDAVLSVYA